MNYNFEINMCAELVNTGGSAGEWLITDEFCTDLGEMGIFVIVYSDISDPLHLLWRFWPKN
jgi:hypothetical protein